MTDNAIKALRHLVTHGWNGIGQYGVEGINEFFQTGLNRGEELTLLAPL